RHTLVPAPRHSRRQNTMNRSILFAGLTAATIAAAAWAQDAKQPTSPDPKPDPKRIYTLGFSQCNSAEPWRAQMDADVRAAAKAHPELKLIAKDAQNDRARQMSHVKEFVTAKVDAIIISPLDTSLTPA